MIAKSVILLGIEYFKQRRGGIAPKVRRHLIDLIHQEHRVFRLRLAHPLDDPARQRSHISAAVAADLGLITDSTQRNTNKITFQRPGNRLGQRSFPYTRRANQTKNRPF